MFSEVGGVVVRKVWCSSGRCGGQDGRCGGQVVSVPATRSALPGFESQARASAQSAWSVEGRHGSLCEYCTKKIVKLGSGWL